MSRDARALLRARNLHPKKSFGQNFLVNAGVVEAIAEACVPGVERGSARLVEIGAGTGALTAALLDRASEVVAVERDRDLLPVLESEFAEELRDGRLRLIEADAQNVDFHSLLGAFPGDSPRVLAGNLPYQITGRLLSLAVQLAPLLSRAVFMVQDEVATRLAASPGSKDYGALTVFVQASFLVRKIRTVSPGSFHPPPEVTSAVVVLTPDRPPRALEDDVFRSVVKQAFAMRRKTLRNSWSSLGPERVAAAARTAGVSLDARGETLSVEQFAGMAEALRAL